MTLSQVINAKQYIFTGEESVTQHNSCSIRQILVCEQHCCQMWPTLVLVGPGQWPAQEGVIGLDDVEQEIGAQHGKANC